MEDCLFCQIVQHKIPGDIVMETPNLLAFRDINPQAPTHILIIPKEHIPTVNDLEAGHEGLTHELLLAGRDLAAREGIAESGYRLVLNCNRDSGQVVFHLHFHLLGGRRMGWPPG